MISNTLHWLRLTRHTATAAGGLGGAGRKPAQDGTEDVNGVDFSPEQARRRVTTLEINRDSI
jgi:hypothetical protein